LDDQKFEIIEVAAGRKSFQRKVGSF